MTIQYSSATEPSDGRANDVPSIRFFFSPGSRTIKAFNEAVSSDLLPHIEMVQAFKDTLPKQGHLILVAGAGSASFSVERLAWRLGGYCVYVPESSVWLTARIRQDLAAGTDLVMVDSSLAKTEQLSGAK
jgi:hypothetical protein